MGRYRLNLLLLLLLGGTLAVAWSVGRDVRRPNYEPLIEGQMGRSPAYDSFDPNPNFPDGMTLRLPPAGTIARGQLPFPYKDTVDDALRAGVDLRNRFSEKDEKRQQRGRVVFANYCQVCHGPLGLGDGPVTQGGFPPPPSLLADRALRMPDGQMFHVLTYGQGRMPPVATQLSPDDRWCAILQVRQLQRLQVPYQKQAPLTLAEVAHLFRRKCSHCHGEDGTGIQRKGLPNIPDFTDLAWQMGQTEAAIVNQIDYGSLPLMPAFRYLLTRDEIVGLAVYVRSFPTRQAGRPRPLSHLTPVEVYQTYCIACHDTTGRGDTFWRKLEPALPDFTSADWQKKRTNVELAQSILAGKGKYMLPMSDRLGSANVQQMVALVREFKGGGKEIPLATSKPPGPPPPEEEGKLPAEEKSSPAEEKSTPEPRDIPIIKNLKRPLPAPSGELAARIRIGSTIFRQLCAVCHGPDGTGNIQRANLPPIPNFTQARWHKEKKDFELIASILGGKGTLMPAHNGKITRNQARDLVAYIRSFGPKKAVPAQAPVGDDQFERSFRALRQQYHELEQELKKVSRQRGK
jgi:mono/diheme cytochrome c family protein